MSVLVNQVAVEECLEAGPEHMGNCFWDRRMDEVLKEAGLPEKSRLLTRIMTFNRLLDLESEYAMPISFSTSAIADLVGPDLSTLNDGALYHNLNRLYPCRKQIEKGPWDRDLFNLDNSIYLYDLTSTTHEEPLSADILAIVDQTANRYLPGLWRTETAFPRT